MIVQVLIAAWFLTDVSPGTDAALRGLPLDDAWIHLVYGRGLIESGLPAYNPGQLETGFTSPLQVVVAAVAVALGGSPMVLKLLTLLCTLPATWLAAGITARRVGAGAGTLAAALLALSPTVAFASLSGMEVGLAGTLMLATWAAADADRPALAGLALAGAVLSRPEVVLFLPIWAPVLRGWIGPALAALAAWAAFDLGVTGHLAPATFYAKAAPPDVRRIGVAVEALRQAWPAIGTGFGLLAWAAALVVGRSWRDRALFVFPVVFVGVVAVGRLIAATDQFFWCLRYFLPVEPLVVVAVAVGVGRIVALRHGWVAWLAAALVLGLQVAGLPARRALYAWNCQNIEEMQGRVADWLAEHAGGARVASVDAGVIRYRGGVEVVDVLGLNNQALLFDTPLRSGILADPAEMAAWMRAEDIRYLFTFPALLPLTAAEMRPQDHFDIVMEVGSARYTIADPVQGRALLVQLRQTSSP